MPQTLRVDSERCAGHGRCYSLVPELFESDDAGYPIVVGETVADSLSSAAADAVRNCPEGAISLSDTA